MNGSTLVIGAGTNLGGRRSILRAARDLLAHAFGVASVRSAPVWETPPLGPPQPDYLNTAFALPLEVPLDEALARCRAVERALGRERRERWGPRTLDLDLLWHASLSCDTEALTVPHRGLRERPFALDPLLALVPDAVDPRDGVSLAAVRAALGAPTAPSPARDDRADRLADAIEALWSPSDRAAPTHAIALDVPWAMGSDPDERARAVVEALGRDASTGFALRRAAVLEDGPARTRAVLFGDATSLTRPTPSQNTPTPWLSSTP